MEQEFINKIVTEEKAINNDIFLDYFKYQNPSLLVKELISTKQNKNEKIVNNIDNGLIDKRNDINRREIYESKNLKKVVDFVEKILEFNKQQKSKEIKILTPKQMLQRLPIALAQVKAGNTFENLLNEIKKIIYSLHREKEVTKKSMQQYNELNKFIKQNGYYIYEFLIIAKHLILIDYY